MIVDIMAVEDSDVFSQDELTFLKEPPKQIEIVIIMNTLMMTLHD